MFRVSRSDIPSMFLFHILYLQIHNAHYELTLRKKLTVQFLNNFVVLVLLFISVPNILRISAATDLYDLLR